MKTEAIVLAIHHHSDNSSIVHLYTREYGRMQYLVYGKKKINYFSVLSVVNITTSGKDMAISTISSVELSYIPQQIATDVKRQCIAFYMAEALYKTMRLPMKDEPLYEEIKQFILQLDMSDSVENIPEAFIGRLSELLGYGGEPIEELSEMKTKDLIMEIIG